MRRTLFAVVAAGAMGAAVIAGLHPVWFALAKLGTDSGIIDWAFWQQSMPAVAVGLAVGAGALAITDRRPRTALALLVISPVAAYVAGNVMLALTL